MEEKEEENDSLDESTGGPTGFQNFFWAVVLPVSVMSVALFLGYKGYYVTRVNTAYSSDKLVKLSRLDKNDYYWGTYRPNVYFGMKTRESFSLVTGLMWYFPSDIKTNGEGLRHWCSQGDNLERYGWIKHDGKNFGIQEIVDNGVLLKISFVKNTHGYNGGVWTANFNISVLNPNQNKRNISVLFYTAIEDKTVGHIKPVIDYLNNSLRGIEGETKDLGFFDINFNVIRSNGVDESYLVGTTPSLSLLKDTVVQHLKFDSRRIALTSDQSKKRNNNYVFPNFIVKQITAELPLEVEVRFERNSLMSHKETLTGESYSNALNSFEKLFDDKFESIFQLETKGYNNDEINFAKAAFSNMIGSISYFYGSARVQSLLTEIPVPYWKTSLFSSVPSRSFYPRGFMWDEGFHGLLLANWDLEVEMDIMSHWFDLMNVEGWIPREMILGDEAVAQVAEEFITQINTNANPPTFFLTLHHILEHKRGELLSKHLPLLEKLYPRLQAWFNWFNVTQIGEISSTYRWRGRNEYTDKELNPKTLSSGLDDYPRASHPNINERHVDLRCWMALASKVMTIIADILNKPSRKYEKTFEYLSDNKLLNELHWSPKTNTYADFGLHTDKIEIQRPNKASRQVNLSQEKERVILEQPEHKFVDSSFGYVSLFPFILQIIDPSSFHLQKILKDLENPDLLWTDYGLRSLAKTSPIYMKYNTERDPPYWRGPIWINFNYLTVAALNHYSKADGPYQAEARRIYSKLRNNIIKNVFVQYNKTGYIWENYSDSLGEGKGCYPFTGWTSLTVLLMAEIY